MRTAIVMTQQALASDPLTFQVVIYERGIPKRVHTAAFLSDVVHFACEHDVQRDRIHVFSVSGLYTPIDELLGI